MKPEHFDFLCTVIGCFIGLVAVAYLIQAVAQWIDNLIERDRANNPAPYDEFSDALEDDEDEQPGGRDDESDNDD